eukprot:c26567_g1_i1 orf=147-368(+)
MSLLGDQCEKLYMVNYPFPCKQERNRNVSSKSIGPLIKDRDKTETEMSKLIISCDLVEIKRSYNKSLKWQERR